MIILQKGETLRRKYFADLKKYGKGIFYITDKRLFFDSDKHRGCVMNMPLDNLYNWSVKKDKIILRWHDGDFDRATVTKRWNNPHFYWDCDVRTGHMFSAELKFGKKDDTEEVHLALFFAITEFFRYSMKGLGFYADVNSNMYNHFHNNEKNQKPIRRILEDEWCVMFNIHHLIANKMAKEIGHPWYSKHGDPASEDSVVGEAHIKWLKENGYPLDATDKNSMYYKTHIKRLEDKGYSVDEIVENPDGCEFVLSAYDLMNVYYHSEKSGKTPIGQDMFRWLRMYLAIEKDEVPLGLAPCALYYQDDFIKNDGLFTVEFEEDRIEGKQKRIEIVKGKIKKLESEGNTGKLEEYIEGDGPEERYPHKFNGGNMYDLLEWCKKELVIETRVVELASGKKFRTKKQGVDYVNKLRRLLMEKFYAGEDISDYSPKIELLTLDCDIAKKEIAQFAEKLTVTVRP